VTHEAAPTARSTRSRVLLVVSVVSAVAALVAATVALTARSPRPVEQVVPEVAAAPPSTIAPAASAPATTITPVAAAEPPVVVADEVPPTTAAPQPSPLAALLGPRGSAIPAAPAPELPPPVGIRIASIGVDGDPVVPVGIDAKGQVEVPKASEVGWYRFGARPGEPGATVLAAHVSWVKEAGVFALLSRIEVGDTVDVALADGSTRTYQVVERAQYEKTGLPAERIWTTAGPETLVLITGRGLIPTGPGTAPFPPACAAGNLRPAGEEEDLVVPARHHPLPAARALVLGLLPVVALAACSYTEAHPDAASQTTQPAPVAVRSAPVVGALPPISADTTLPVAPAGAADDSAPLPGAEETTVPDTAPPPEATAPATAPPTAARSSAPPTSAAASGATVSLQAGSFKAADGAKLLQQQLAAAGFPGFSTQGSGPFRVVRGGLSESDAGALRQRLSAAGFQSFVVRG
jgi:Sortase domain/SPOR domain